MNNRLETLQQMLAQDPNNTFVRYGLAQEYASNERLEEALAEFARLIELDPNYSSAYFHGGKILERLGRLDDARAMYERGVAACQRAGNAHALSEMQGALDEIAPTR